MRNVMAIIDHYATSQRNSGLFLITKIKKVITNIKYAFEIAQQRHDLQKLDNDRLKDIGITKYQADMEINRDFWDTPEKKN